MKSLGIRILNQAVLISPKNQCYLLALLFMVFPIIFLYAESLLIALIFSAIYNSLFYVLMQFLFNQKKSAEKLEQNGWEQKLHQNKIPIFKIIKPISIIYMMLSTALIPFLVFLSDFQSKDFSNDSVGSNDVDMPLEISLIKLLYYLAFSLPIITYTVFELIAFGKSEILDQFKDKSK